jgi:hypothetical protein
MSDFFFLEVELDEVAPEIDSYGFVGLPFGEVLDENVGDQPNISAEGAVIVIESVCGDCGIVMKHISFELNDQRGTFLSLARVYSSMTLLSPLGRCRRLPIAIFSPCLLVLFSISSISSSISYNKSL